jgi:two-component system, cell cycle response regulator
VQFLANGITSPRVLVVDDLPNVRRLFSRTLRRSGMHVVEGDSGPAALRLAMDGVPDAIVSDFQMPEMDGLELCRRIRANPSTRHAKFVIVSASLKKQSDVALEMGCDAVLEKPCAPALLLETLRWLLGTTLESDFYLRH